MSSGFQTLGRTPISKNGSSAPLDCSHPFHVHEILYITMKTDANLGDIIDKGFVYCI